MTSHPTEPKLPESLEVVAWLTSWPKDRIRPAGSIVNRQEPQQKFDCNQYSPLVRLSDAESALKARDAEIERLRGDAERWRHVRANMRDAISLIANYHYQCATADEVDAAIDNEIAIDQARATGGEKANG